jgi:hypothetical protein
VQKLRGTSTSLSGNVVSIPGVMAIDLMELYAQNLIAIVRIDLLSPVYCT